ncbi:jg4202 [Pararge aegeria aegeria]|uniref:Jg4202 protein n=1 Tax=Pararge aegeria aegeria TaxID=348720 RepID=A0A8S4R821_9NEOP|nr:jg4202 [Pararge aegeria aegeria]
MKCHCFNGEGKPRKQTCISESSLRRVEPTNPHLASVVDFSLTPSIVNVGEDPRPVVGRLANYLRRGSAWLFSANTQPAFVAPFHALMTCTENSFKLDKQEANSNAESIYFLRVV